jgi:DNA topoisomerase-1
MNAIKTTGKFKIMSIGRVQGPTLKLIVDKEKEISKFVSEPYWQVFITIKDKKHKLELKYVKDIFDKNELKEFF